jgi:hypothetical protein
MLVVSGCATTKTTARSHPTLETELHHVNTVVILPPRVEIVYVTLTGENERMTEKENEIRNQLVEIAERRLANRGYELVDFDFSGTMASDEEFAYTITQVREGFDRARKDLDLGKQVSEEEANKIRTSVGEAVNIVAAKTGADAIFLMRYAGFDKSGGQVAKDVTTSLLVGALTAGVFIPVSSTSGAVSEAALIDGLTGEVLWANVTVGALDTGIMDKCLESCPRDIDPVE